MSRTYDDIAAEIHQVNQELSRIEGDNAALINKLGQLQREQYQVLSQNQVAQNHRTYRNARDAQRADQLRMAIAYIDRKLADSPNLDPSRAGILQGDRDRYAAELARLENNSANTVLPQNVLMEEPTMDELPVFDVTAAENKISSLSAPFFERLPIRHLVPEVLAKQKEQLMSVGTPEHVEMHPKVAEDILVEDGMTRAEAQEFIANLPEESDLAELPPPPADSGLIPPVEAQAPDSTPVDDDSIPF